MKTPVAVCENDKCEKVIRKGKKVWHKDSEMYAQGNVYFNRSNTLNKRFWAKTYCWRCEMSTCKRCNRPLKTPKSIDEGYGPVCKRKHEEAEAEFLKRQVTIYEELEFQERMRA